jgi:hypothetical protein
MTNNKLFLLKWIRFTYILSLQNFLMIQIDYFVKMHLCHFIYQNSQCKKSYNWQNLKYFINKLVFLFELLWTMLKMINAIKILKKVCNYSHKWHIIFYKTLKMSVYTSFNIDFHLGYIFSLIYIKEKFLKEIPM